MTWLRKTNALLKTRFRLKYQSRFSSLCEFLLPILFLSWLVPLHNVSKTQTIPASLHRDEAISINLNELKKHTNDVEWRIGFAPKSSPFVQSLLKNPHLPQDNVVLFESHQQIQQYIQSTEYGTESKPSLSAAVIITSELPHLAYTIRMNTTYSPKGMVPPTNQPFVDKYSHVYDPMSNSLYLSGGFIAIQGFLDGQVDDSLQIEEVQFVPFPTPEYNDDAFASVISDMLGFFTALGYVYSALTITKVLVEEKQVGMKQALRTTGLDEFALAITWFLYYVIFAFFQSFLICCILHSSLYPSSSFLVVFFLFFLFTLSIFSFSYFISSFFSHPVTAATASAVVFIMGTFASTTKSPSQWHTTMYCLMPSLCMSQGATLLTTLTSFHQGITLSTLSMVYNNFTISTAYLLLFVDIVLYFGAGWYLTQILPSSVGTRRPFWFVCSPAYWGWKLSYEYTRVPTNDFDEDVSCDDVFQPLTDEEQHNITISTRNLEKVYASTKTSAVEGMNLNLVQNQIFVLLGHNGAGKTTLCNMLTGFIPPSSGDVSFEGRLLSKDGWEIRQSMAICPQKDILWPTLTVHDHLQLFGCLKSAKSADIDRLVEMVGLSDKRHTRIAHLSGGQKRKLCVVMALMGDSKYVFLDEPTAGMDVSSRRQTWDLIKQAKQNKVIVLTTHFMEEADYLGDRIGIMAHGRMKCTGSSLFLKNVYGVGYILTCAKSSQFHETKLHTLITKHVKQAHRLTNVAGEISYRLPFEYERGFPMLFEQMERFKQSIGITTYGVSVTTLEEVLLKVAYDTQSEPIKSTEMICLSSETSTPPRDLLLSWQSHVVALLEKRWHTIKRDCTLFLWLFLLPLSIIGIGLMAMKSSQNAQFPSLVLDTRHFSQDLIPMAYDPSKREYDPDQLGMMKDPAVQEPSHVQDVTQTYPTIDWTSQAFSEYLLATYSTRAPSYGAFYLMNPTTSLYNYQVYYNCSAAHSAPIYLNQLNNALLRSHETTQNWSISVTSQPFPLTHTQKITATWLIALVTGIAFAFLPSSFVGPLVRERCTKVLHQQYLAGVSIPAYWLSNWIWDTLSILCTLCSTLLLMFGFRIEGLFQHDNLYALVLLFLVYALSLAPFNYVLSRGFTHPLYAQNAILFFNLITGPVLLIVHLIHVLLSHSTSETLLPLFRLFPQFSLCQGLLQITFYQQFATASLWDYNMLPVLLISLTALFPICLVLLCIIESIKYRPDLFSWTPTTTHHPSASSQPLEHDVRMEQQRVLSPSSQRDPVRLVNVEKTYRGPPQHHAVRGLTFGVRKGECFGFLGVNGAGKSTTLEMLTGEQLATKGKIYFQGLDSLTHATTVRRQLGYCPQVNALVPTMTAREHLLLYATLRGFAWNTRALIVEDMLLQVGLSRYADQPAGGYSGGNKRKLCVAIALIGNPPIVLLDEPSTGMDPASRRTMWKLLSSTMQERVCILTTHSMEECQALCDRIGIMVQGQLRCLGTPQHLKHRFGEFYQVDLNVEQGYGRKVDTWIHQTFQDSQLVQVEGCHFSYRIPKLHRISRIFQEIQQTKETHRIFEYSVADVSLDQIFLGFAREAQHTDGRASELVTVGTSSTKEESKKLE